MSVVYWDNNTTIRHRVGATTPSPYPDRIDIALLFIAFFLKRLQIDVKNARQSALRSAETTWLWTRFFITYRIPQTPAGIAKFCVWVAIVIQKEEMHTSVRRIAVTSIYAAGALLVIGIVPKVLIMVWSL